MLNRLLNQQLCCALNLEPAAPPHLRLEPRKKEGLAGDSKKMSTFVFETTTSTNL
jgi:hypothetical protein